MNDLLDLVLDAHGGLRRWSGVRTLAARLAVGGPFWMFRGFPDAFSDETVQIDVRREHAVITPWIADGQSLSFDTEPERVTLRDGSEKVIDGLLNPRPSYADYDSSSPWDALQVGYFLSYATWNYLTIPFLLTYPGVHAREIGPRQADGQTWRRLLVTFPDTITTDSPEQVFYFGDDGLLRRADYTIEINAGARVAHYTEGYEHFDGFAFPTRRRIYGRNSDGTVDQTQAEIILDIHHIRIA
jgi:hypothetical protein